MTADPGVQALLTRLKLPPQNLETLSFCEGDKPAKVEAWANSLPLTRMSFVSGLLYQALPEISQLKTSPRNRLQMLDSLHPATQPRPRGGP
jgi:cyclic-di-GMP-binding protein